MGRLVRLLGWPLAGVVVGLGWWVLTPVLAGRAQGYEVAVSPDVTLAGLEVLAGVVAGVAGLLHRGPGAAGRFAVAVLGSAVASGVAWGVGRLTATPRLTMPSVLLFWPLTVAAVTVLVTLVATLVLRDPYDDLSR